MKEGREGKERGAMGMDGEGMYEGKIEVWLRLTTSRLWLRL